MGILDCNLLSRKYSRSTSGNSATLEYYIETDDPFQDPDTILDAPGYTIGTASGSMYCSGLSSDIAADDHRDHKVTVTLSSIPENPLDADPEVAWSFQQFQRQTERDIANNAIVDSSGMPSHEPVMIDDSRPILNVSKNAASFNANLAFLYRDKVNSNTFTVGGITAPAKCAKVVNITGSSATDPYWGAFWRISFSFAFNADTWRLRLLDRGFYELDAFNRPQKIRTNLVEVTSPVLLDGHGQRLPQGQPAVFRIWDVLHSVSFAAFGL